MCDLQRSPSPIYILYVLFLTLYILHYLVDDNFKGLSFLVCKYLNFQSHAPYNPFSITLILSIWSVLVYNAYCYQNYEFLTSGKYLHLVFMYDNTFHVVCVDNIKIGSSPIL